MGISTNLTDLLLDVLAVAVLFFLTDLGLQIELRDGLCGSLVVETDELDLVNDGLDLYEAGTDGLFDRTGGKDGCDGIDSGVEGRDERGVDVDESVRRQEEAVERGLASFRFLDRAL